MTMTVCDPRVWFTSGHHGCKRGTGKPLGLHNHLCPLGKHYRCQYCGARWVR